MVNVILRRFESPDETRMFARGKFEVVHIGGMTIGRATYEPGWRWSEHVGRELGSSLCQVEHVGLVVSGRFGESHSRYARRNSLRDEAWRSILHSTRARQLGCRRRTLRIASFNGRWRLCQPHQARVNTFYAMELPSLLHNRTQDTVYPGRVALAIPHQPVVNLSVDASGH